MASTNQNFTIWADNHKDLLITVRNDNSVEVDLTSSSSIIWVLSGDDLSASLVRKATGGDGVTISGCTFTVSLSPADTGNLAGTYYHEAQVTNASGDVSTVTTGMATINRTVI